MENQLIIIMAVFTGIAAIALCIQAGMLFGIYKSARATEEHVKRVIPKVESMLPKVETLVESSTAAVDMSRKQIQEITAKASDILDVTRLQLARIDGVLEDASTRAHNQLAHAEMVIDETISRAQETVATVQNGIMVPLREIQGVAAGVRTAIFYLMRGGGGPGHGRRRDVHLVLPQTAYSLTDKRGRERCAQIYYERWPQISDRIARLPRKRSGKCTYATLSAFLRLWRKCSATESTCPAHRT